MKTKPAYLEFCSRYRVQLLLAVCLTFPAGIGAVTGPAETISEEVVESVSAGDDHGSPSNDPERIRFALSPDLSLEQRRYLAYLYARLGRPALAELLAEMVLEESPGDKQTLLVLASMYLETGNTRKAMLTARELVELYPNDHQALYFLGAAHYQAGEYATANEILRNLKRRQFSGRLYPYETQLAAAAMQTGDWYRGMLAYQELLNNHPISDELRQEVRRALDAIYRTYMTQLHVSSTWTWIDEATLRRTRAAYERQMTDRMRLLVQVIREDVSADEPADFRGVNTSRTDWTVAVRTRHSQLYESELRGGVADSSFPGGATLVCHLTPRRQIAAAIDLNKRAIDSVWLNAVDGREHRFAGSLSTSIGTRHELAAEASIRQVRVDGETLGRGAGTEINLDRILFQTRPHLRIGYRARLSFFSPDDDIFVLPSDAARRLPQSGGTIDPTLLVRKEINNHGIVITTSDQILSPLHYRTTLGIDYGFVEDSWQPYIQAGLIFWPRKSIEISLDGGYSANSFASNLQSSAWNAGLNLRWFF